MKRTQSRVGIMALALAFLAAPIATRADELRIQSFENTGGLTFNRIATGQAYRVESATSLTGAWSRLTNAVTIDGIPTTMDCIPAMAGGIVTGTVPVQASSMFFRAVTETNDMVLIPAGEFVMGACTNMGQESLLNETPQHTVYVDAFYMERYEVTKALWDDVRQWATNHGYSWSSEAIAKGATHPVVRMSWQECVMWCNARSEKEGLTPCYSGNIVSGLPDCDWSANGYRLPTEAEWEKAARGAVSGHRFSWSDTDTIHYTRANYWSSANAYDTSGFTGYHPAYHNGNSPYTSPVGSFAPNGYGLYDMEGNVGEWCWDKWADTYYSASPVNNPRGPNDYGPGTGNCRVSRGGCYSWPAEYARVCYRWRDQWFRNDNKYEGFRTVRTAVSPAWNHPPVIVAGESLTVTMSEDGAPRPFSLTLHAMDADNDPLKWTVEHMAVHGTATANGIGKSSDIAYLPASNYSGNDSFVVQAYDPWGAMTSVTINVTIETVNDAPVAYAQAVSVATNTPQAIMLTGSDIEGSNLFFSVVADPTHGSLSGTPPNVTYTPGPGYKGADAFTFKVNDNTTDSVPAMVTLWVNSMAASGGTTTNYTAHGTNYTAHIFTTVGTTSLTIMVDGGVEVLVVAGGGGGGAGGAGAAGGGGAGGLIYTNLTLVAGSHTITVGAGGIGSGAYANTATPGSNSVFDAQTAYGGGCGMLDANGVAGGSGAGGFGKGYAGGSGSQPDGYGNNGGAGGANPGGGGGGGGAGSVGGAGMINSVGGNGGTGLSFDISGTLRGYSGGGGGGAQVGNGGTASDGGGLGGGVGYSGVAGALNCGGGGGGGGSNYAAGGNGGSGIVIVRYGIAVE